MSTYESDHNLNTSESINSQNDGRRQYHSLSSAIDAFLTTTAASNRERLSGREIFENALRMMGDEENSEVIQQFLQNLDSEGTEINTSVGVDDAFLDALERVDLDSLSETADCPICTNKFVHNKYPLIVKLPCFTNGKSSKQHIFDMDCIAPWLKVNSTCPMCRCDMHDAKKARREHLEAELRRAREQEEEDEEDDDRGLYG
ncbi:hypothetical protein METBIDRAFT_32200 [Metschnikowia bicuspidata var. bicuspidata NRRL YB-4993]|uniref:RING-type domain-containing protein n=1 Tax=Metschnikowia bicuspidata var. bicuspidata NRRL YB-4993 TaxID=869754 RepID=A0A1A0HCM3_9ASCO|nr:hypothetical protein METBIDRAFT_32200 [Metschnikowia bicuspidata var. bicuspidata NRRL YB-4993]OBA21736.1 hypothetical protein METBIDRAFT_32200 [Metschnikowia bicuspidata var. bicuspidata NRRL YB-4993]